MDLGKNYAKVTFDVEDSMPYKVDTGSQSKDNQDKYKYSGDNRKAG